MATRVSCPELIGRAAEMRALEEACERAASGVPGVVLIAGESGVGKSRLLAEFGQSARARGQLVLTGDCVELSEGEIPFAPVVSALRRLGHGLDADELDTIFGGASGELISLFPDLARGSIPGPDSLGLGALGQARLFEFLLGVLQRLAEAQPTVLVIEDLHWADASTRDLLFFLARTLRDERLLIVATYRSDELHRRHPLRPFLTQLGAARGVERIELERLTHEQVGEQLGLIRGEDVDPQLVDAIFALSEGNPLFTEELLSAGSPDLPATLRDALLLRVEALSPNAQQAVRAAAAAGRSVQHGLLAVVLDVPEAELFDAIRDAIGRYVLVEAGDERSYAFRHALLREAVYSDLLPGERGKLHVALARAIEADPDLACARATVAAELASHWYAAHELPCALRSSIDAGFESERLHAYAEAQRHFERALELWEKVDQEQRVDHRTVLRHAAAAAHNVGDADRSVALGRALVEEIDAEQEPEELAFALERLGRYLWMAGRSEEALPVYRRAVEVLPQTDSEALAQALGAEGQVLMLLDQPDAARDLCNRALPIARAVGARRAEANILNTLVACAAERGDTREAIEFMDEARAISDELGLAEETLRSYVNGGDALDQGGQVEAALELALQGAEAGARLGLERHMGLFLRAEAAGRLLRLGRWDEAIEFADRVLEVDVNPLSMISARDARALIATHQGDLALAHELLDPVLASLRRHGGSMWIGQVAYPLALLALREGRVGDARSAVEDMLGRLDRGEYVFYTAALYWVGVCAGAEEALIERFDGQLARYSDHPAPPQALAWRALAGAELERLRGEAAPALWTDAAEQFEQLGQIADAAYARYRLAEALAAAGASADEVESALVESRRPATGLQMAPLLADIDALAQRTGLAVQSPE